jgi:hypothetical protein
VQERAANADEEPAGRYRLVRPPRYWRLRWQDGIDRDHAPPAAKVVPGSFAHRETIVRPQIKRSGVA